MTKWALFAGRDGDVFRDEIAVQSEEAARAWAAKRIASEFGFKGNACHDMDEAFAHCDGVLLEITSRRPAAAILEKWAVAQIGLLAAIGGELDGDMHEQCTNCGEALARLADAARLVN